LRDLARFSASVCDRILFVSQDSADWIGDSIGLAPEKRVVVHHGIDREAWSAASKPPVHPWPYILSVSSIYRYKNFVKLIEAYALLAKRRRDVPDLMIVGDDQDPEYARKMEAARAATRSLAEHIHIRGEIPYSEIPSWYAGAELFVFPSYSRDVWPSISGDGKRRPGRRRGHPGLPRDRRRCRLLCRSAQRGGIRARDAGCAGGRARTRDADQARA
jgi:glycosyltransferase involved in cell wall biosynthesis